MLCHNYKLYAIDLNITLLFAFPEFGHWNKD